MYPNDILRKKLNFILFWLAANILGCSVGWTLAEVSSRFFDRETEWITTVFVAALVFEGFLWLCRSAVLKFVENYKILRSIDILIMAVCEAFGWLIGEGVYDVTGTVWITAGAMWAVSLGGGMWLMFWFMRLPKPKTRFWPLQIIVWTFIGMVTSSLLLGLSIAVIYTVWFSVSQTASDLIGWLVSGAVTGAFAGVFTGLAFVRFLFVESNLFLEVDDVYS